MSRPDRPELRTLALALLASLLLWNLPFGGVLLYPFKLLATWLHDLACQAHPELLGTRDGETELCAVLGMTRASYEYLSDLVAII